MRLSGVYRAQTFGAGVPVAAEYNGAEHNGAVAAQLFGTASAAPTQPVVHSYGMIAAAV